MTVASRRLSALNPGAQSRPPVQHETPDKPAAAGDPAARKLATYWVGQGMGLMNRPLTTRQVVYGFLEDFAGASERLASFTA